MKNTLKRARYKKTSDEIQDEIERDGHHYADALPEEAMQMSKCGVANGYDDLRYGVRWADEGLDPGRPVVQIDKRGVQLLVMSDDQKAWIQEAEADLKRWERRRKIVRKVNLTRWEDLPPINREYLLSLHWVPAEPYTAMEIIAIMAKS